jgi:hypothetical protein
LACDSALCLFRLWVSLIGGGNPLPVINQAARTMGCRRMDGIAGRVAVLAALFTVAGCATMRPPPPESGRSAPTCSYGFVYLRFQDESAALESSVASGLELPAWTKSHCSRVNFNVVGLPGPSDTSLAGRRSRAVIQALEAFGVPPPSFKAGAAAEQGEPILEVRAAP